LQDVALSAAVRDRAGRLAVYVRVRWLAVYSARPGNAGSGLRRLLCLVLVDATLALWARYPGRNCHLSWLNTKTIAVITSLARPMQRTMSALRRATECLQRIVPRIPKIRAMPPQQTPNSTRSTMLVVPNCWS